MKRLVCLALAGLWGHGASMMAAPIRTAPGLVNVIIWEATSSVTPFFFSPGGPEITTRIATDLGSSAADFTGTPSERYDIFYSNADGTFNLDGEFLTIEGNFAASSGSGFNIAHVVFDFDGFPFQATSVASFVMGSIATGNAASVNNVLDSDLNTWTTMGRTSGDSERIRLTLGFTLPGSSEPSEVPEPSTYAMLGLGLAGMVVWRRRS